jgi:hypothetical protein
MGKIHNDILLGKSTISTGPFSKANCQPIPEVNPMKNQQSSAGGGG